MTLPRTAYRVVDGDFRCWLVWTAARLTCPCRDEKGKEDGQLTEPYISPAKQPIKRRVSESFLNGPPMTLSVLDDVNNYPAYFLFYYLCFVITVNDRMAQDDSFVWRHKM